MRASAPIVRPWKPPAAATTSVRPVRRVSLKAASLASAPELAKKTLPGLPSQLQQGLGQLDLPALVKKLEMWPSVLSWSADRLDQRRVGVAERVDGDAAEQVEVDLAVGVPDVGALAAGQHQLRRTERVHQRGGVPLAPGAGAHWVLC